MVKTEAAADLGGRRQDYRQAGLRRADVDPDPIVQFARWYRAAEAAGLEEPGLEEPNAMTLATATAEGRPSARMVLLKGVDKEGFTFFTNYDGRKAGELAANPWAALVFWWAPLARQVRVEGRVGVLPEAESDAYFAQRPRGSQTSAWASPQSQVIPDRTQLVAAQAAVADRFAGQPVPRPPHWGGYRLAPTAVEFWQGRPDRLHDRFLYSRNAEGGWRLDRLAP